MNKKTLISLLHKEKFIKHGIFVLRSGKVSSYYCDIKQTLGNPKVIRMLTDGLATLVPNGATCIAGSGYGGLTLASLVAYKKGLPLTLVRDVVKHHGTKQRFEGYLPGKKDVVCIIDDVYTTGSSLRDTKTKLMKTGCRFTKPIVALNRSEEKSVIALLTSKDIEIKKK